MEKVLQNEFLACLDHELIKIAELDQGIDVITTLVKISSDLLDAKNNTLQSSFDLETFIIIGEIVKFALKVATIDKDYVNINDKNECQKFFNRLKEEKISSKHIISFLKENPTTLEKLSEIFAKNRYLHKKEDNIREIDNYSCDAIKEYLAFFDSNTRLPKNKNIKNLDLKEENINKCREDIIKGIQIKQKNVDYEIGHEMFASSNIGKMSEKQEDSVLILNHPKNRDFKISVVADGLGGYKNGGEASNLVVRGIIDWFEALDPNLYYMPQLLPYLLDYKINSLNDELLKYGDGRATTFVSAIVCHENMLVSSLGDSRCYITEGSTLKQISVDDSVVQSYFEKGLIKDKEAMRFHKLSNRITNFLGLPRHSHPIKLQHHFLKKTKCEYLALVSDGVSDCLSEDQIKKIILSLNIENIAKSLVYGALNNDSYRLISPNDNPQEHDFYYDFIPQGKDNATAAVLCIKPFKYNIKV